jgi:hypothetical protein
MWLVEKGMYAIKECRVLKLTFIETENIEKKRVTTE